MAMFHLSAKPVQRSKGRTATASSAYRAGEKIEDKRTGRTHDYTRKKGVEYSEIITPQGVNIPSRNDLWNMAELAEKRKDSCTAREYEVNLPHELTKQQRIDLAKDFSKQLADKYGIAVDLCMHEPNRHGDDRNYHAHIMTTTRKIDNDGLGEKADIEKAGRKRKDDLKEIRALWADTTNKHLEMAGIAERIDHRSLSEQGSDHKPTVKMGWQATQIERQADKLEKQGKPFQRSFLGDINRNIKAKNGRIDQLKFEIYVDKGKLSAQEKIANIRKDTTERTETPLNEREKISSTLTLPSEKTSLQSKLEAWKAERAEQARQAEQVTQQTPVKDTGKGR